MATNGNRSVIKPLLTGLLEPTPGVLSLTWDKEDPRFTFSFYYSLSVSDYKRLIISGISEGASAYGSEASIETIGYANTLALYLSGLSIPYEPGRIIWIWITATDTTTGIEGPFSIGKAIKFQEI